MDRPTEEPVPPRSLPTFTWVYVIAAALALAVLGIGIYRLADETARDWTMLAAGGLSLVAVAVTWPIALTLNAAREANAQAARQLGEALAARLEQVTAQLNVISSQQLLSDRAKHIAYRDKDRDAFRRAVQEEIAKQDWDSAQKLADDIEREFGYKGEADRLRGEIADRRRDLVRGQVKEAMSVVDRHTRGEQWNSALREAERLRGVFPDDEQVRDLPREIENRRQAHKRSLLDAWNEAVARHDTDGSIEILKQLDTYLTPAEAERMQETVRLVFKEKLNNLGKQFSNAVQDHKWREAIDVGDTIVRDFPNTRIAQEVREKMDLLRQRAAGLEPAGA
jgi:hypothetical protein